MTDRRPVRQRPIDPTLSHLLRATAVSHARVRRLAALRVVISAGLAATGLFAVFVGAVTGKPLSVVLSVIGVLWALAYSLGLASWADRELLRSALLQEAFEVRFFHLPWNCILAGDQISPEDVRHLSSRYRGDPPRDHHEMPNLPRPFDVLARQQQNLAWGSRVRRRYAQMVMLAIIGWALLGLITGMLRNSTITDLFVQWCVPSLGMFMLGWDTFREQRTVAADRKRVCAYSRARCAQLAHAGLDPEVARDLCRMARQVQDQLFLSRRRAPRVPRWFFQRYYAQDCSDFSAGLAEARNTLLAAGLQVRARPRTPDKS
ncbi:S-4TM family putative pore-forming effector [Actinoplanes oblitus]|uniref:S-4TM family putative pore-forming effector n=1 Tax=Actinoplanes oblitus TaxID=3040509 RepID=A0ABY8WC60_9ACTN|nr:S-4TM family putative pore-forming effector [Actinoplanes oblitus]WIM93285.1 S-4TM family putative pore-forming effector [Actinoplanes oblitus]